MYFYFDCVWRLNFKYKPSNPFPKITVLSNEGKEFFSGNQRLALKSWHVCRAAIIVAEFSMYACFSLNLFLCLGHKDLTIKLHWFGETTIIKQHSLSFSMHHICLISLFRRMHSFYQTNLSEWSERFDILKILVKIITDNGKRLLFLTHLFH
jgi:hypothetical protein